MSARIGATQLARGSGGMSFRKALLPVLLSLAACGPTKFIMSAQHGGPPKATEKVLVLSGVPSRPFRVLGEMLYEATLSVLRTGPLPTDRPREWLRKKAAKIGADGVLGFECGHAVVQTTEDALRTEPGMRCRGKPYVYLQR